MATEEIYTDTLFVGLTRPTTPFGVPYEAVLANVGITSIVFVQIGNPLYMLLIFPVHGILYLITAKDPGALASVFMWVKTIGRCRNRWFWGAASFSPVSTKKWRR